MSALVTIIAVLLDAALGEPRRWHPLVGFGSWAQYLERHLNGAAGQRAFALRLRGVAAVLLAVAPWVLLVAVSVTVPPLRFVVDVAVLYFALGHQSLRQHALRVHDALRGGNLDEARGRIAFMVSRDTGKMNAQAVAAATVESVLENGNDAVFAALFWFVLAGAPGVLLYRLANTLDAMWGYRTPQYLYFGWAGARLDDVALLAFAGPCLGESQCGTCHGGWRRCAGCWSWRWRVLPRPLEGASPIGRRSCTGRRVDSGRPPPGSLWRRVVVADGHRCGDRCSCLNMEVAFCRP
jgi:adenosylcobinamide-phosphate synthase